MIPMFHNRIPSDDMYRTAQANIVPEQMITETVDIYKDAIPYIICELQSTIQHEGKHRSDEEGRSTDVLQGREVNRFEEFSSEGNMEPRAEREEEACVPPSEVGEVVSVNLFDLFEKAKAASNIDSRYLGDIHAGSPGEGIAGMYLVQDMPQGISANPSVTPTGYEGFDGRIWIDVRKQIQPWIAGKGAEDQVKPSTYQDDGIIRDTPGVSQQMIPSQDAANTIPAAPMSPAVPSVESR